MKVITSDGTFDLGVTETTPTIGITDYSRRETDDFGVTTVVERGFARRMSVRMAVPFDQVDGLQRRLAALRATAATWVADDQIGWLTVEGLYKEFDIDLNVPPTSFCTLTVEGLAETAIVPDPGGDPAPGGHASTLQLLSPIDVTDPALVLSNVPEDDAPAWAGGATYATGARVIRAHRVFESLTDTNSGNDPADSIGSWLDLGPTNRWAMFDEALGTATERNGNIGVTLAVGAADAVALLDVTGATVRVQAGTFDQMQPIVGGAVVFTGLPLNAAQVAITIAGAATSVGTLLIGRMRALGITEASPTAGITDFSRKDVDDFGEVAIVERAWAKRMATRALIRTDAVDLVANRIAAVRARPSLWIGATGIDSLTVYGFFRDFSIEVAERVSKLSVSIEGLSKAANPQPIPVLVEWPAIADPEGTKPADNADVTGENTAQDTANVDGRPSSELVAQIDQAREDLAAVPGTVERIDATIETLTTNVNGRVDQVDGRVDLTVQRQSAAERASRQLDRQLADIGKSLLRVAVEADRTRATFRDAGIHVDSDKGKVRIEAIDQTAERVAQAQLRLTAAEAAIELRVTAAYVNQKITEAVLDPSQIAELEEVFLRITTAEQTLDALNASIVTKADAQTLTNLGLVVTDVTETIDALNGLIQSKAETSTVDALGTRVGAVETTLDSLGDVVGISTEIRQVRYSVGLTGKALLEAIVAGDELKRGQVQSQASIQSQLTTTINEKVGAEAASRQALSVELGAARADMVDERAVRAAADRAEAAARVALGLQFGQANADVLERIDVLVQADSSQVERANQIAAAVGQQASDITEIRELNIDRDRSIAGITTALRQSRAIGSDTAHSLLSTIVAADEAKRQSLVARSNLFSQVTSEITEQGEVKTRELRRLEALLTGVDSALKAAVTSLNQAIVNGNGAQASALQSVAAALEAVQGELNAAVTRLDQANVTQDTAMSESLFLVNAAISTLDGNIDAAVTRLDQANVDQDNATAQSLAGVNASIESLSGTVNGEITRLDQVSANVNGKASVQSVTELSLRVGEAEGGITNLSSVTSDIDGRLKAIHGVLLDVNGRVSGTISENDGVQSSFEILSDVFRISATGTGDRSEYIDGIWRVYAGGGATLKAYGSPFGSNGQFVSWFGPQIPLDQCTEANAISYEKADGSTYFGGSLSLGTLRTAFTNPSLGASVTATGDPFGSNGKTILVTASWSYQYVTSANYNSTTEGVAQFDAEAAFYGATDEGGGFYRGTYSDAAPATTLALERSVSGGGFAGAAAQSSTTRTATFQGQRPVIGDAAGWSSVQTIAGLSFTFVDPQLSTAVRNYRVILARGFNAPSNAQQLSQAVTFTAVEQPNV